MDGDPILVWDRQQKRMVPERVQDQDVLRTLYGTAPGRWITGLFFSRRLFSRLYAASYGGRRSRRRIEPFVRDYAIDLEDFEDRPYASFNDFFARRFRPGARSFGAEPSVMPAFAESRCLAWIAATAGMTFPVKGQRLDLDALLGDQAAAAEFRRGPVIVARLATQDYHRVHVVDAGKIMDHYRLEGPLHSVHPIALSAKGDVLSTNLREVTIQQTESFGRIAYVEVGAMTVGRIVQHLSPGDRPRRGDEKSHFEYGASTVVLLGQPDRWIPDPEILDNTRRGFETFVRLGTPVARAAGTEGGGKA